MGSLHIKCKEWSFRANDLENVAEGENEIAVTAGGDASTLSVRHTFLETTNDRDPDMLCNVEYEVRQGGVLRGVSVVDTTGAGDAFIGGYLMALLCGNNVNSENTVQFGLEFGAWVAGTKLGGPGARSALPPGSSVDRLLGEDGVSVSQTLKDMLVPFASLQTHS